jgi:hypothetical protein
VFEAENPQPTTTTQQLLAQARRESAERCSKTTAFLSSCQELLLAATENTDAAEKKKVKLSADDVLALLHTVELGLTYTPGIVSKSFTKSLRQIARKLTRAWGFEVK